MDKEEKKISLNTVTLILICVLLVAVFIGGMIAYKKITGRFDDINEQMSTFDREAESHDFVAESEGIMGYTAADFASAILGDKNKLCKLEVMKQDVSDVVTITDTGFANWSAFTKTQLVTYHGKAVYTVDLSNLRDRDIELDDAENTVTVYIPHARLEPINIQSEDIEFGDVSKGILAFGDIKMTPEDVANVQTMAQNNMEEQIKALNIGENADKFAKMVVWDLYQPVVNSVAKGYSLKVEFK